MVTVPFTALIKRHSMTRLPIVLAVLLTYIVVPPLLNWITDPTGVWYKPFVIWLLIIAVAFTIQLRSPKQTP